MLWLRKLAALIVIRLLFIAIIILILAWLAELTIIIVLSKAFLLIWGLVNVLGFILLLV